ncbi:dihydrofolate reductase [Methylopila musalis]|uniref:Dihydrofolate reductase n=1 Tax=Methylopila musalis TaxID=1134781 RepID=A0ABW3Z5Y9_9HYPH
MSIPLVIVAAVARNRVIGRDNDMPWKLSSDLKRFKALTIGKPLIVGRRNHAAIGRALPGRQTIVLTRDRGFSEPGVHVAHELSDALGLAEALAEEMGADEIISAGGGEIYALTLPLAARMHLTEVHATPEGDVLFPEYDGSLWRETSRDERPSGPRDEFAFSFVDLARERGLKRT